MIAVRIVRRFKVHGQEQERTRIMDVAALPVAGVVLDLGNEHPPVAVAGVTLHTREIEFRPGLIPPAATVRLMPEPGDRLETAEVAGWRPIAERQT